MHEIIERQEHGPRGMRTSRRAILGVGQHRVEVRHVSDSQVAAAERGLRDCLRAEPIGDVIGRTPGGHELYRTPNGLLRVRATLPDGKIMTFAYQTARHAEAKAQIHHQRRVLEMERQSRIDARRAAR